jgi:hypothetical protein
MIDIVSHFFILYPMFTFIKETTLPGLKNSNVKKFAINFTVLVIATVLTNAYLMDSGRLSGKEREKNLYEIFET